MLARSSRCHTLVTLLVGMLLAPGCEPSGGRAPTGGSPPATPPAETATPPEAQPGASPPQKTATDGACDDHDECAGGYCIGEWSDDYCSAQTSACSKLSYDSDAICIDMSNGSSYCLKRCTSASQCRTGYVCTPDGACMPSCTETGCPADAECGADGLCYAQGSGGGSGSGTGSGGGSGIDLTSCTGPASSSGTLMGGASPHVVSGKTSATGSGLFSIELLEGAIGAIPIGAYGITLQFAYSPGQLDYPVGSVAGGVLQKVTTTGYQWVETTQMCELHLSVLNLSTAPLVCDGMLVGTYLCLFSGNSPLGGSLQVPVRVAASQLSSPSCRGTNAPCSQHSDCCSGSCSMFIGVCN